MQKEFGDQYYGKSEELEKPDLSDESDIDENWLADQEENDNSEGQPGADGDQGDRDDGPSTSSGVADSQKGKGKRKRRTKVSEAVQKSKPLFDPKDKKLEEYLDEYYKLDFEDVVGSLPCRFKYRTVTANNFGLSEEEIMLAPDRELNAWCSLKKAVQYRSPEEEMYDVRAYKQKASLRDIKLKIIPSLADVESKPEADEQPSAKKRRKRKSKRESKVDSPEKTQPDELHPKNGSGKVDIGLRVTSKETETLAALDNRTASEDELGVQPKKKEKRSGKTKMPAENVLIPCIAASVVKERKETTDDARNVSGTSKNRKRKRKGNAEARECGSKEDEFAVADSERTKALASDVVKQARDPKPKKKRKKSKKTANADVNGTENAAKRMKASQEHQEFLKKLPSAKISDERLKAYGLNPKRHRQTEKYVLLAKSRLD